MNLLAGLATCSVCGGGLVVETSPRKRGRIREKLRQRSLGVQLPAISTVHAVLDRHGLVHRRRRHRGRARGTTLSRPTEANALWCADYKGEFMLGNRRDC